MPHSHSPYALYKIQRHRKMFKTETERQRDRDRRERERQRQRQRDGETERETEMYRQRHTQTERDRETKREEWQRERERETDRQTDTADRQSRQTGDLVDGDHDVLRCLIRQVQHAVHDPHLLPRNFPSFSVVPAKGFHPHIPHDAVICPSSPLLLVFPSPSFRWRRALACPALNRLCKVRIPIPKICFKSTEPRARSPHPTPTSYFFRLSSYFRLGRLNRSIA